MIVKDVKKVRPLKTNVLVSVLEDTNELFTGEEKLSPTDVGTYFAEVYACGPNAADKEHCPDIKEGDIAFFSQFSGYHISTPGNSKFKLIPSYDIMATVTITTDINKDTVTPTADRYLIEVFDNNIDEDGLVLDAKDSQDPRLQDLSFGKILKGGPSTEGIEEGTVIAYAPYCGEKIRDSLSSEQPELRVIREDDILMII
jgi:co-chaperonin GroES (HSP10)